MINNKIETSISVKKEEKSSRKKLDEDLVN